ncbi:Bacterial flagellin N-terminus domain protein [Verrucomicrobiia bacterium DG1235]|nr:Bacterial flagellin N-terminus domain protein [Verrucomicrobiae bacterium DG1235]
MQLSRSLARLSSGSKIINPSDDAAGLAVSEKLEAQNSRIRAAKVNAQNAVSLVQTADGFLSTMSTVLNRMSELSMLAKDVTKNPDDIALYGTEFDQLKDQLRDIIGNGPNGTNSAPNWNISGSEPTGSFNGISLFGARPDLKAVVGANGDQTMNIGQVNLREIGGALSDLLWDNSVDSGQADISVDSSTAMDTLIEAVQQVADNRATLGAVQSRLEIVDAQLQVQSENLTAANSRIRDVDVAEESTRLAKYQILVQSGTAMLSQANSLPESVLRLLN